MTTPPEDDDGASGLPPELEKRVLELREETPSEEELHEIMLRASQTPKIPDFVQSEYPGERLWVLKDTHGDTITVVAHPGRCISLWITEDNPRGLHTLADMTGDQAEILAAILLAASAYAKAEATDPKESEER